jgi:hypothetical protein
MWVWTDKQLNISWEILLRMSLGWKKLNEVTLKPFQGNLSWVQSKGEKKKRN